MVKSRNERNPLFCLACIFICVVRNTFKTVHTAFERKRKEGRMSSQYGLYELGYTRATKAVTMRDESVSLSKSLKAVLVRIVLWKSRI